MSSSSENILFVIPSLNFGGAEFETIDQVNSFYKKQHNVTIVILSDKYPLLEKLILPDSQIFKLNIANFTTTKAKNLSKLPRVLHKFNKVLKTVSVTTVVAVLPLSHLVLRTHALLYGNHYKLWCYHKSMQYQATPINSIPKKILHRITKSLSYKYDYGHIFISNAVKNNISKNLPIKNGYVIHNAVPYKVVSPNIAETYMQKNLIQQTNYLVVIPGRLHPTKGHQFFINTLKDYLKGLKPEDITVVIAGGGSLENEINEYIQENDLKSYFFITGFIDNDLMLSFLHKADLVVVPSIHEGFGNVVIETLMQGTTVLASNAGGLSEIIKDAYNGFSFKKLDANALHEKFVKLHSEKIEIDSSILKKDYEARFAIDSQIKKLLNTLKYNEKN